MLPGRSRLRMPKASSRHIKDRTSGRCGRPAVPSWGLDLAETKNIEVKNIELPGDGDQLTPSSVSASSYRPKISSRPVRYRL